MSNRYRYVNVVDERDHGGELTLQAVKQYTENFTKPAVFRKMVDISPRLTTREFYEAIDPDKTLQWRRKQGDAAATMRTPDGKTDYNYVIGQVGRASEFLDDIFERRLDVYSHLGTISAGYKDPYEWGKSAFLRVREEIFRTHWFRIDTWQATGHMFFGYSNHEYGEPVRGAVGSDWHMFPTLNVFVMIAGTKKWMTRPPRLLEQLEGESRMFSTSSGREAPGETFGDYDTVFLTPGDVLLNLPYEWHKVLNARGLSLGGAFRIVDTEYIAALGRRPTVRAKLPNFGAEVPDDVGHLLTSLKYASFHLNRAQMMLNDAEHVYPMLLKAVQNRGPSPRDSEKLKFAVVE
ncbi:MAG: hypothetical protein ACJ8NR_07925 [Sulfurifustis sp.]